MSFAVSEALGEIELSNIVSKDTENNGEKLHIRGGLEAHPTRI
jgi:hypothetical protein